MKEEQHDDFEGEEMDLTKVGGSNDIATYVNSYAENTDPTRYSMHALTMMEQLDPLLLKNKDHLTAEDRETIAAFERRTEKRIKMISDRCNFFELIRNHHLFQKDRFLLLLNQSI